MIFLEINDINSDYFNKKYIRDENDYNISHLLNSENITLYNLLDNYKKILDKNKKYLIIFKYDLASQKVVNILNNNGYNTFSLKGGYMSLMNNKK